MRLITTVLLSTLCLGAASLAHAEASAIVLGLRSVEGDDDFANALTEALRKSAHDVPGWQVMDRSVSMTQMSLAHGCDEIDAACLTEIAKGLQVARVVYGTVRRTSARSQYDYQVSVSVFDADTSSIGATETGIIRRTESGNSAVLAARASSLMQRLGANGEAEGGGSGMVSVQVNVSSAEVRLDEQMIGQTQNGTLLIEGVTPGRHTLQIYAAGHRPYSQQLNVSSSGQTNIITTLAASTGDEASEEGEVAAPSGALEPAAPRKHGSLRWLGYTLVGVGAASVVGVVASWMVIHGINNDQTFIKYSGAVHDSNPGASDLCHEAEAGFRYNVTATEVSDVASMCRTGQTFQVLQWVFLGAALVSGSVGTYLLVTEKPNSESMALREPSFALTPQVGRHSLTLETTLRF